jgi:hypothetical protein
VWVFTETGFVSAVQDWNNSGQLVVRARDRQSLLSLADAASVPIEKTPTADYPYRVHVMRTVFTTWVADCAESIDYPNFKARVEQERGSAFAHTLLGVWGTMVEAEDETARTEDEPNDITVPGWVIDRVRQEPPTPDHVVEGATPVVAFGDPFIARVATVGINPAPDAFTSSRPHGKTRILSPLLDRNALGISGNGSMSRTQAAAVAQACSDYFANGIPHTWFLKFERQILPSLQASYCDRTASHLDLAQWPTRELWGCKTLPDSARAALIEDGKDFLERQLREHPYEVLLLDGRSVMTAVASSLGISLRLDRSVEGNTRTSLEMFVGHFDSTLVLGWSIPIHGHISTPGRADLTSWVGDRYELR